MKKNIITVLALSLIISSAYAGGNAFVTCGDDPPGVTNNGKPPILHVQYSSGEAGLPGLFYLGVSTPDGELGALRTGNSWTNYKGGMLPFQSRYDGGMPASIYLKIPFPGGGLTTDPYVGYQVGAGHGVFTPTSRGLVEKRQAILERTKSGREAGLRKDFSSTEGLAYEESKRQEFKNKSSNSSNSAKSPEPSLPPQPMKSRNKAGSKDNTKICVDYVTCSSAGNNGNTGSGSGGASNGNIYQTDEGRDLLDQQRGKVAKNSGKIGGFALSQEGRAYAIQQNAYTPGAPISQESMNYVQALVQADMKDNNKYQLFLKIPFLDCRLPPEEDEVAPVK